MSTDSLTCAATPAALAQHVDYAQRLIENTYPGGVTISFDFPVGECHGGDMICHWRDLDADNGRGYSIWAFVTPPVEGEGQLRLYVDVKGGGYACGEVVLTTNPAADYALISALNTIAEINEKQAS